MASAPYLQAYASHSLRSVYNVNELDLAKVAKSSSGFPSPPAGGYSARCKHGTGQDEGWAQGIRKSAATEVQTVAREL